MQHELSIAIFAGLLVMLGWGLADFFAKITIDAIGDVVSLVWAHICGSLFLVALLGYLIATGKHFILPSDVSSWSFLIFFGTLQALIYLLVYRGFGKGQVALLNPVFASFAGIVALVSITLFGEKATIFRLFDLITIFLGILLISLDVGALRTKKIKIGQIAGFKEIGIATILAAIWTLSWDKFVNGKDWLLYAIFMYLFMTIVMWMVAKVQNINLSFKKNHIWKFLALIGICESGAYMALSLGYGSTSFTSVVALISGAFSLPTIILARIFLKEKVNNVQTVGSMVIILGIILLSLL